MVFLMSLQKYTLQSEMLIPTTHTPTAFDELDEAFNHLDKATTIGHNNIDFDLPAIKKVRGWQPKCKLIDTLLMSRMLFLILVIRTS